MDHKNSQVLTELESLPLTINTSWHPFCVLQEDGSDRKNKDPIDVNIFVHRTCKYVIMHGSSDGNTKLDYLVGPYLIMSP